MNDEVEKWIADNSFMYDLTTDGGDYSEDGFVERQVPNPEGIAQMYRDMLAAGVGRGHG